MNIRISMLVGAFSLGLFALLSFPWPAGASEPLRFGMTAAFSGPASELGVQMRAGILAGFRRSNAEGGIRGRELELVDLDDGYRKDLAVTNARRLLSNAGILGLIGNVGTPTAKQIVGIASQSRAPIIGPLTGAAFLRDVTAPHVVNFRASYRQEVETMIELLLCRGVRAHEIAVFAQDDGYGKAIVAAVQRALADRGYQHVQALRVGTYMRNTSDVGDAVRELLASPQPIGAVIMAGTYLSTARFVKLFRRVDPRIVFASVSFVSSRELARELGPANAEGILVTEVVPSKSHSAPIVREFAADLAVIEASAYADSPVALEGYIVARMLAHALLRHPLDEPVTRASVHRVLLELGEFDLGLGAALRLAADDRQASASVWPVEFAEGLRRPVACESGKWITGDAALRTSRGVASEIHEAPRRKRRRRGRLGRTRRSDRPR